MSDGKCRFCGADGSWPAICKNTRDLEESAVESAGTPRGERCYATLKSLGGGESGMASVDALRASAPTLH